MATIEYPKNTNVSGLMAFPLYSEENIEQVKEWRERKQIAKPKYPDRIGATLMLNQAQHDKVVAGLAEYLKFAATLKAESAGKKGIDPKLIAKLQKLVADQDWTEKNLPIRDLTEKDVANMEKNGFEGIVSKLSVSGPMDGPIKRRAIIADNDELVVVSISEIADRLGDRTDVDALWWGSSWPFKTSLRFNAYDAARYGVTAYISTVYLLAEQELKQFGGDRDSEVLEDGDDWE